MYSLNDRTQIIKIIKINPDLDHNNPKNLRSNVFCRMIERR